MAFEVVCVSKDSLSHYDPHEGIVQFGWRELQGNDMRTVRYATRPQMVEWVEQGLEGYVYNDARSTRARLMVATAQSGRKYVKTVPDGTGSNNLLQLDNCPL